MNQQLNRPLLDWQTAYAHPIVRLVATVEDSIGEFGLELTDGSIFNLWLPNRPFSINDSVGTPQAAPYGTCDSPDAIPAAAYVGQRLKNLIYHEVGWEGEGRRYFAVLEDGGFLTVDMVFTFEFGLAYGTRSQWQTLRSTRFYNAWDHTQIKPAAVYR